MQSSASSKRSLRSDEIESSKIYSMGSTCNSEFSSGGLRIDVQYTAFQDIFKSRSNRYTQSEDDTHHQQVAEVCKICHTGLMSE